MSLNTVFILKNDKSLQKIGTIDDVKNEIRINAISVESVNYFNEQLFAFIKADSGIDTDIDFNIKSYDITGIVFHILRWRRCTGYLVIQKSNRGIRYICYLYDKIKHNAQCFGTTCEFVSENIDKIKQTFIDKSKILSKSLENNINYDIYKESLDNIESNIVSNFGI